MSHWKGKKGSFTVTTIVCGLVECCTYPKFPCLQNEEFRQRNKGVTLARILSKSPRIANFHKPVKNLEWASWYLRQRVVHQPTEKKLSFIYQFLLNLNGYFKGIVIKVELYSRHIKKYIY